MLKNIKNWARGVPESASVETPKLSAIDVARDLLSRSIVKSVEAKRSEVERESWARILFLAERLARDEDVDEQELAELASSRGRLAEIERLVSALRTRAKLRDVVARVEQLEADASSAASAKKESERVRDEAIKRCREAVRVAWIAEKRATAAKFRAPEDLATVDAHVEAFLETGRWPRGVDFVAPSLELENEWLRSRLGAGPPLGVYEIATVNACLNGAAYEGGIDGGAGVRLIEAAKKST